MGVDALTNVRHLWAAKRFSASASANDPPPICCCCWLQCSRYSASRYAWSAGTWRSRKTTERCGRASRHKRRYTHDALRKIGIPRHRATGDTTTCECAITLDQHRRQRERERERGTILIADLPKMAPQPGVNRTFCLDAASNAAMQPFAQRIGLLRANEPADAT